MFVKSVLISLLIGVTVLCWGQPYSGTAPIVLKNATLVDVVSGQAKKGDLCIQNSRIKALNYDGNLSIPGGSIVYDCTGKYIIPGLIDAHVHLTHGTYEEAKNLLHSALMGGVTTVRDMGGDGRMLVSLQRNMSIGEDKGADVYFSTIVAGERFYRNDPRPQQTAKGAIAGKVAWQQTLDEKTDFKQLIAETKGIGATAIKIYTEVGGTPLKSIVAEAKKQGIKIWAHAAMEYGDELTKPSDLINAGVEVVSHAGDFLQYESDNPQAKFKSNSPAVQNLLHLMKEKNCILDATLWVYNGNKARQNEAIRATKLAYEHGVKIAAGSDDLLDQSDGTVNLYKELALLHKAGLSTIDILRAATVINAEVLGKREEIGSIEVGKLANLVVLNSNPLDYIGNVRDIRYILKRGLVLDGPAAGRIDEMHALPGEVVATSEKNHALKYDFIPDDLRVIDASYLWRRPPTNDFEEIYYENGKKANASKVIPQIQKGKLMPLMFVNENSDYVKMVVLKEEQYWAALKAAILEEDYASKYDFISNDLRAIDANYLLKTPPVDDFEEIYYENGEKAIANKAIPQILKGKLKPLMFINSKGDYVKMVVLK